VSTIRLPTVLRAAASGQAVVNVEGTSIRQLLEALQATYPAMAGQVLTGEGDLHRFVNVYVNDDDVRYLRQLDTPVGPDDVVSILPAVAGGVD
jgi:molybdopterin synthase sulfur carrier subunit